MRRYLIYLLDDGVAMNYFGKEEKLYQLFLEADNKLSPYHSILLKQIDYITKKIPLDRIHRHLASDLGNQVQINSEENVYEIRIDDNNSRAILVGHSRFLNLYANGTYEAETIFFESLRKVESSFLAMDFRREHYGWLNPIKHANIV